LLQASSITFLRSWRASLYVIACITPSIMTRYCTITCWY